MGTLRVFRNILSVVMTACLALMSVLLAVQIFSRQVLGFSFTWVPDLSQVSLIVMVLLGSFVLTFDDDHIRVDFLETFAGERAKLFLALFRDLLMLIVVLVVVVGAWHRGLDRMKESFATMRFLRIGHVYYAMLAGFGLQGVWLVLHMIQTFAELGRSRGRSDQN